MLEQRLAKVEEQLTLLITKFLPPVIKRLEALESQPRAEKKPRRTMTYATWRTVKSMLEVGSSPNDIAKALDIPPSTVRAYRSMSDDRVAQLKAKEAPDDEPVATVQSETVIQPRSEHEEKYLEAQQRSVPQTKYAKVNSPTSLGDWGAQGWHDWTLYCREEAADRQQEGATPVPCEAAKQVQALYKNGSTKVDAVGNFDWIADDIVRWRLV